MPAQTTSAFDLPDRLDAKRDPELIAADDRHFAAVARFLEESIAELTERIAAGRKAPGGGNPDAVVRDMEIHRLTARRRTLRRYGIDLCLGRMVRADDAEPLYIGRLGLMDDQGKQLLIDWRSPAAEPFFGATYANPMGLVSRRRYRWTSRRISDYWDEVFAADATTDMTARAALDDQAAFIASLGTSRSSRMRDVLSTIQAEQDAVIRAGSPGTLVVDGGPGTGKTVVALHRSAYLVYSDPRLSSRRGGVLFVGPNQFYLAYVSDVLPSLGEEGIQTCTLRDLVTEGATVIRDPDPEVARLKSSADMVRAIEAAVRFYEEPPTSVLDVETPWADFSIGPQDWAEAFDAVPAGTPHNEARETIWDALLATLTRRADTDGSVDLIRNALRRNRDLTSALHKAWPMLDPAELVGDLWAVPAYLRMCAPWLTRDEVQLLRRADPMAWTVADLPLLDTARRRLGDPNVTARQRLRASTVAEQNEKLDLIVADLIAADDSDMMIMSMLRGDDLRDALIDDDALPAAAPDTLAGPFAHIVVDEAQELTDAEWQMLISRCPSRSFTIVGDRAQARHGFTESWSDRLHRVGLDHLEIATLSVNYRTPAEVMAAAEPVIRTALPDANVPRSVRRSGIPVRYGKIGDLTAILDGWLTDHGDGIACVIGELAYPAAERVRSLSPEQAKGLEFDLVVLVDPDRFGDGTEGVVDRYVAMTRATQELVILSR